MGNCASPTVRVDLNVIEYASMNRGATGTAPGKVILFGEHAVVYGQPAIAVPVGQVSATATVEPAEPGSGLTLVAPDLPWRSPLAEAPEDNPLAAITRLALACVGAPSPDATLTVRSTIPIASGMGSGAAVSAAIVRALAGFLGHRLEPAVVSRLVFEVDKLHHGTPSGIDNTVVAFGVPVYFVKGETIETLSVGSPLHLVIADTGIASPTRLAVADVRRGRESTPQRYERMFALVGEIAREARVLIEVGSNPRRLGQLMDRNHSLLRGLGVSCPELERLVLAARVAGAWGAKLSGAGRGGNMIALVAPERQAPVGDALRVNGAARVIRTTVTGSLAANG